ncbi:MAG TPA: hypothetical protein ENJ68_01825 [Devosia sp.]|nr:hypothetical protein [Devosia sp.]
MISKTTRFLAIAALAGTISFPALAAQNMAHAHMGHVATAWSDTPDQMGFLPTAIAEAQTALVHANLAAQKPDNLEWMKTHALHVLNAIDPAMAEKGPGLGYGVKAAAAGVLKHIGLAAASDDASENVKTHARHVAATAQNTLDRVAEMETLITTIEGASSADEAAPAVAALQALAQQLLDGADANGDGAITWVPGEGGLNNTQKHMTIMINGEDM